MNKKSKANEPEFIDLNGLLDNFNLGETFDGLVLKLLLAQGITEQGGEAVRFIHSKFDSLLEHIRIHKKPGSTPEELKVLIMEWIVAQDCEPKPTNPIKTL